MLSHSKTFLIDKDYSAIQKVLPSGMIFERSEIPRIGAEGKIVTEFENAVAEHLGMFGGAATNSGTMALFLVSVGYFSWR